MSRAFSSDSAWAGVAVEGDRRSWCWLRCRELGEVGAEGLVGLAGDVALEAADDLAAVEAFGSAAVGVGAGAGVVAEAADGDHVERAVGLAVAALVEAVAAAAAAAGLDRGGRAE